MLTFFRASTGDLCVDSEQEEHARLPRMPGEWEDVDVRCTHQVLLASLRILPLLDGAHSNPDAPRIDW